MLKYVDAKVVFAEVPDEVTLAINISNCPCYCIGCHSPYLSEDIGEVLDEDSLGYLINKNKGITCVAFMGGDGDIPSLYKLAAWARKCTDLKIAWYSGMPLRNDINLADFDFIKAGRYIKECGPLNSSTTNQRFYKVVNSELINITNKFWKHETEN